MRIAPSSFVRHRYGFTLFIYLIAAALTGTACVTFMRMFDFVLKHRVDAWRIGLWAYIVTPIGFLISAELTRRLAPCAAGTGIPQAIFAARHISPATEKDLHPLISWRTLCVKILGILVALLVGASTGREGPTVHVATCVCFGILIGVHRWTKLPLDLRSVVVAGGAAGLAAAFNTPLAGVTFAIEELTADYFSQIKDYVLIAIIVAGLAAQALTGEYTYFGKLIAPPPVALWVILIISLLGGGLGAIFSVAMMQGQRFVNRFQLTRWRYVVPIVFGWGVLVMAHFGGPSTLGPGNLAAQRLLSDQPVPEMFFFPWTKMASTWMTYCSGIAGGIFAPCLGIGATLGASLASLIHSPGASCALLGMVAFLSGTIQAPITSFVIIYEMTGDHRMLLPAMLASLLGFMVARLTGAKHLYAALAENYASLLPSSTPPAKP